jgi:hypothetical protein
MSKCHLTFYRIPAHADHLMALPGLVDDFIGMRMASTVKLPGLYEEHHLRAHSHYEAANERIYIT